MMQSRLVENWLTSAKELSYTIPFAQLLMLKGYEVVHISRGGSVEQGKDVIALDAKKQIHCFQLKCGNIGARQWRDIKTEVDELVELPPIHPSIPKKVTKWHSYLVTNGVLNNTTARTIADYSQQKEKKGHSKLKTILKDELVEDFTRHFGQFFPDTIADLTQFLDIYNQHGDNTLDNAQLKSYFERYFSNVDKKSLQKKKEAISASVVVCSYLLTNKYTCDSFTEIVKAWILLLVTIYQFGSKWGLSNNEIKKTETLIIDAIELAIEPLIDEIVDDKKYLTDGSYDLLSEPFITHKIRCTELLGLVSAYLNHCTLLGKQPYRAGELEAKLQFMAENKCVIGEACVPLIVNYAAYLANTSNTQAATKELSATLTALLSDQGRDKVGTISPYYSLTEAASMVLKAPNGFPESFEGRSYSLWTLVLLLARLDARQVLEDNWLKISQISCMELAPDNKADLLAWSCESGKLHDKFPASKESFAKLKREAVRNRTDELPGFVAERPEILPCMLVVMPQRFSPVFVMPYVLAEKSTPEGSKTNIEKQ